MIEATALNYYTRSFLKGIGTRVAIERWPLPQSPLR